MATAAAALQTIPGPTRKAPPTTTATALETPAMAAAPAPAPATTAPSACSGSYSEEEEIKEFVPTTAMTPAGCRSTKKQKVSISSIAVVAAATAEDGAGPGATAKPEEHVDPPPAVPIIHYPKPNDILFGRSYSIQNRPGNRLFRRVLESYRTDYNKLDSKKVKIIFVGAITIELQTRHHCRFLMRNSRGWYKVPDTLARRKVSLGFRDLIRSRSSRDRDRTWRDHRGRVATRGTNRNSTGGITGRMPKLWPLGTGERTLEQELVLLGEGKQTTERTIVKENRGRRDDPEPHAPTIVRIKQEEEEDEEEKDIDDDDEEDSIDEEEIQNAYEALYNSRTGTPPVDTTTAAVAAIAATAAEANTDWWQYLTEAERGFLKSMGMTSMDDFLTTKNDVLARQYVAYRKQHGWWTLQGGGRTAKGCAANEVSRWKCTVRAKHQQQQTQSTMNENRKRTESNNTKDPDTVRSTLPTTRTRPAVDRGRRMIHENEADAHVEERTRTTITKLKEINSQDILFVQGTGSAGIDNEGSVYFRQILELYSNLFMTLFVHANEEQNLNNYVVDRIIHDTCKTVVTQTTGGKEDTTTETKRRYLVQVVGRNGEYQWRQLRPQYEREQSLLRFQIEEELKKLVRTKIETECRRRGILLALATKGPPPAWTRTATIHLQGIAREQQRAARIANVSTKLVAANEPRRTTTHDIAARIQIELELKRRGIEPQQPNPGTTSATTHAVGSPLPSTGASPAGHPPNPYLSAITGAAQPNYLGQGTRAQLLWELEQLMRQRRILPIPFATTGGGTSGAVLSVAAAAEGSASSLNATAATDEETSFSTSRTRSSNADNEAKRQKIMESTKQEIKAILAEAEDEADPTPAGGTTNTVATICTGYGNGIPPISTAIAEEKSVSSSVTCTSATTENEAKRRKIIEFTKQQINAILVKADDTDPVRGGVATKNGTTSRKEIELTQQQINAILDASS